MDPLEDLRVAVEAFLAAGGTPEDAQALMMEMAEGGGAMPPEGGDMGLGGMPLGDEMEAPIEGDMPPPQPEAKTFDAANAGATERLKKLNRK